MGKYSLNHRGTPESELPLFTNRFLRAVPYGHTDSIIAGDDAGFTCPKCSKYTKKLLCKCGTLISQIGEEIEIPQDKNYDVEFSESPKNKESKELKGIECEFDRRKFTLFSAKSIGDKKVQVHMRYYGTEYKITFTPRVHKMIDSISEKSRGKFKRKRVVTDIFNDFLKILGELSRNPDKYNLLKLKAFKK